MKKILMSVAALFLGWSMVSAQDYSAEFKDAEGTKKGFNEQTFTLAGKEWHASFGYYDEGKLFRLGRRSTDAAAPDLDSKYTSLGINAKGAVLEMNWDFENITSFSIVAPYNWEDGNKVSLLVSTDEGATYQIIKTETIEKRDEADVERFFSDETAREKARYTLAIEGAKEGQCRLNLTQVFTNRQAGVDETAPEISYIVTKSSANTAIEVHFSEKLDKASAETAANYALNNGITVSAAVLDHKLDTTDKTVVLTTTAMTDGTAYELTVNGVKDEAGNAIENGKITFTFGAIEVDDIAAVLALRETYADAQQYRIKGEVVVVAHVGKTIYVQDKNCENTKGHSLALYDQPGTYADKFPAGTVLTKVAGSLTIYNNLLEMQYLAEDITENGTADVVISKATIKEVYKDVLYHAALVQFTEVEFDEIGTFEGGKNYRMDDPTGYMNLHVYASDNIVGEKIPTEKVSVTGYVGVYNGTSQLILRDKSDIVVTPNTANENGAAVKFSAYPNPTSGLLTLDVEDNNYNVRVFTVAGVEVMNLKALNGKTQINLEGMAQGIYVVEIATANGTSRAKVVLR